MQQLVHDAISTLSIKHPGCQGLFAGSGNLIEKLAIVTDIEHPGLNLSDFCQQSDWLGIYLTADRQPDPARIRRLSELIRRYCNDSPACYLLLESGQKGRVEARLFADTACTVLLPLALQEDGGLYPAMVNR